MGSNGTGKSTALKILAGKLKPNLGRFDVRPPLPAAWGLPGVPGVLPPLPPPLPPLPPLPLLLLLVCGCRRCRLPTTCS